METDDDDDEEEDIEEKRDDNDDDDDDDGHEDGHEDEHDKNGPESDLPDCGPDEKSGAEIELSKGKEAFQIDEESKQYIPIALGNQTENVLTPEDYIDGDRAVIKQARPFPRPRPSLILTRSSIRPDTTGIRAPPSSTSIPTVTTAAELNGGILLGFRRFNKEKVVKYSDQSIC